MRHLDQLANKSHREGKLIALSLAVARKELATGKHLMRRYRQIIRVLGDRAGGKCYCSLFQERADAVLRKGHREGLADTGGKTGGWTASASP